VLSGQRKDAIAKLRACIAAYLEAGMRHEVARDQAALGILLANEEGAALRSTAEQTMHDIGVVDVAADIRAHYPEMMDPDRPTRS
jgi:DNA mismatch repair protein MutH